MKRIITLLLALILCPSFALAQVDLSGMTYDELVALKDQINLAIWASDTWQEVEVPYGVWVVGEDIPVGKWTIKPVQGTSANVHWGSKLDEAGTDIGFNGDIYEMEWIYDKEYRNYEVGDPTEITWDLKEGQYFVVANGIVVFSPYSGKPSLGFK